ncbi:hypothetical protein [Actinoplanes sp. M2I2]|uniref:hypothetical protein n=1 Tax=Actinoplanes sp. M2I2 TaxID=1734444 RepID=UPI0020204C3B|nr:hypothetical protein [Actinoplanes sp. M2I2]
MADGTDVNLDVLAALATRLEAAGDDLDVAGNGAPGAPDAGDFTAVLADVVAHLTDGASTVVLGLKEAAARVEQSRDGYAKQDAAAAADLQGLF